ncbi:uncharacterized protein LOC121582075 isoform X1 [Coregonus clupeaformis]|uniref:uncharacterized protein LOC121582075 isoform X1 n=1 Tax=Coregonus clupeaformis TaxID=59861 RepID=UPI001BE0CF14|nr:uncharacterized protein LOC121582075 isoform X1 [Coregonus clupeaformis]
MASTQQFAFEYVQNGRAPLEGHLQKPSLVVDELRKHNILSEKQVREIKSHKKRSVKTRKMLDMVMKKGEYASYELLKILYNTRNQTFPRTNPTQNQPRHPDLHQWISCFSFTDDPDLQNDLVSELGPCERYKRQLRSKAVEFLHAKWDQHMHFLKDKAKWKPFSYIPVVLDTDSSELSKTKSKYKKARSKKLKTYIPRDKGKLSPGHLLESNEKKILLVGKPGIGKTTVVQQVLSLWAENENHQESYMFYFDEPSMRSMSHSSQPSSLRSLLFERYLKPEEGTEDVVLCDIQNNSENVIFVFDGIMDVIGNPVLNNILAKELLCDAKILTTCRPEAEDCEFLSDWPSYRVEVQGFNNESIQAYLKWMLGTEDDYVCSVASNDALFSLCHVPMYAFIVTACISFSPSEANNHPCTITEMYVRIFRHCMKRHGDQNVEYLDKYIHDNMGNIKFIATNSFQALLAKTVNLTGMDCKDNRVQRAFLTSSAAKELSTGHSFAFLHNTMQEFWAALFLLMTPGNITAVLQQCQTEEGKYLKYIVSFLCGLLSSDIAELINCVVPEDQIREISDIYLEKVIDTFLSPATLQGHDESHTELDADLLFVCQCLYERQSPEACSLLLQKVEYELDLNGQYLDPQQCCAVSYVINQSKNRNVCLYLNDCTFSDPGLRLILGSLKNLQCLRLDPTTQCQLWKAALHSGNPSDSEGLLRLCEYEIHLRVKEQRDQKVWERVGEVLKRKRPEKVKLCLHLVDNSLHAADSLGKSIFDCLPSIEAIRFVEPVDLRQSFVAWKMEVSSFQQDILLHGALYQMETGLKSVEDLQAVLCLASTYSLEEQSKFILSLYQHIGKYESDEGVAVLPTLQPVFKSFPAVWYIHFADTKASVLLEVMKLQNVKKPVELWWSNYECDMNLIHCLPYISQLRFNDCILIQYDDTKGTIEGLLKLFCFAKQHQPETGEETLRMLSTVCSYSNFPFASGNKDEQSDFLLDLYSSAKLFELELEGQILPSLLTVFQSAQPAAWVLDLSTDKASILLEVLKLQTEKKPVRLKGWLETDKSKIRSFLLCLPYISQLRIIPQDESDTEVKMPTLTSEQLKRFFLLHLLDHGDLDNTETGQSSVEELLSVLGFAHSDNSPERCLFLLDLFSHWKDYETQTGRKVCQALLPVYRSAPAVWSIDLSERKGSLSCDDQFQLSLWGALPFGSEWDAQLASSLLQALDYTITLSGWLPTVTCNAVGAVLGQSAPGEKLNVSLTPDSISFQGAAVLFKQVKEFHKLKVNEMSTAKLARLAKSTSCRSPMVVEELTLVLSRPIPKEGVQCRVLSGLASLLRVWTVRILNLRDCPIQGFLLTTLLCHQGPLTIRLSKETLQQLAVVVYEAQDEELTQCFLEKLGSDLSNCTLDWDVLHYLLKSTTQPITINLRRSRIRDQYIPHLLPLLKNVHFQRTGTSSQFERTALREIHEQRAGHLVNSLVRSSDEWINLNNLVLNHDDCEALRFALHYSDGVKLNLLLTIIPKEEMESILTLLHRVSELRVDRNLLLELLHTCAGLRTKRGAAPALLTVLHHKLDLSCSSAMDLFGQEKETVLSLSFGDCRVISAAIQEADGDTELILHDCHVDDAGLEELLHVFHRIHMSFGKPLLLQLLHLRFVEDGDRSVRLASLLSRTLEKKMDLSQSPLDARACSTLALLLEHSEGLSELDLSDCHLTDTHLDVLLPHLHKVQVLNLCNNEITDKGAVKLNLYMIGNSFTETVWLSNNMITEFDILMEDNRYKLCPAHVEPGWHDQRISSLGSTSGTNETSKTKTLIEEFDPDKTITDKKITYRVQCGSRGRFQCRATGLVFGMRGPGIVEYSVVHWDRGILANTSYEPAGPLFQLRSPEGHMYQLHLPHCEVNVSAAENLLVAHICRNNREFLIPKVTHSHVIVSISGLSHYGKARKKQSNSNRIQGQVLLFLEPEATPEEKRLWVFLLPRDMPPDEVENQHKEFTFIKTSSSCMLTLTAKYSVTSDLKQGFSVQPKKYTLHIAHCPYQHATFEVFLNCGVTELKMNIWETTKLKTRKRWTRRVILNTPRADNAAQVKRFTEQQWIKNLCEILGDLSKDERKRLKSMMRNKEQKPITKSALEGRKSPEELAELMVETWGMHGSIKATREFMERLPRRDDRVTSLLQPFL